MVVDTTKACCIIMFERKNFQDTLSMMGCHLFDEIDRTNINCGSIIINDARIIFLDYFHTIGAMLWQYGK